MHNLGESYGLKRIRKRKHNHEITISVGIASRFRFSHCLLKGFASSSVAVSRFPMLQIFGWLPMMPRSRTGRRTMMLVRRWRRRKSSWTRSCNLHNSPAAARSDNILLWVGRCRTLVAGFLIASLRPATIPLCNVLALCLLWVDSLISYCSWPGKSGTETEGNTLNYIIVSADQKSVSSAEWKLLLLRNLGGGCITLASE